MNHFGLTGQKDVKADNASKSSPGADEDAEDELASPAALPELEKCIMLMANIKLNTSLTENNPTKI